jgi:putative copper resistance protein D
VLVETLVVPVLLVLGAPLRLALATLAARDDGTIGPREVVEGLVSSRAFAVVGDPVVAAALLVLSLGALVGTGLLELALTTHSGHVVATAWFMVVGSAFAWSVVRPGPARPRGVRALSSPHDSDRSDEDAGDGPRLVVLLAVTALHVAAGLALSRSTQVLAPDFFKELHLPWVTDLLADQQRGGALYGLLAVLASVTLVLVVLAGERGARRSGPDAPDTPPSGTHRD